ncbi:MAG: hypothetical protein ACNA7U_08865 [Candidatus Izemoplasmataceae bacterium]|jgi:hypothetical protein
MSILIAIVISGVLITGLLSLQIILSSLPQSIFGFILPLFVFLIGNMLVFLLFNSLQLLIFVNLIAFALLIIHLIMRVFKLYMKPKLNTTKEMTKMNIQDL